MKRTLCSLLGIVVLVGCGDAPVGGTCRDGTPVACTCADGRHGVGTCGVDGCDCLPTHALQADPATLDFGEVPRGTSREAVVLLGNPSSRAVRLRAVELGGADPAPFSLPDGLPVLPAHGRAPITVRFTPTVPGTPVAWLRVEPDDADVAPVEVPLAARVTGPVLSCAPAAVEFGDVWVGELATVEVVCTNVGVAGTVDDARLSRPRLATTGDGFSSRWLDGIPDDVAVGESVAIGVMLRPPGAGEHRGSITITGSGHAATVPLRGSGAEVPACDVEVVPGELRFPIAAPGTPQRQEVRFVNRRADAPCTVRDVRLCDGTHPAFVLEGGPFERIDLPPGLAVPLGIAFTTAVDACSPAAAPGCLEFELSPSPDGRRSVPVSCAPGDDPYVLVPTELDFGPTGIGCPAFEREVQLVNFGAAPVEVGAIEVADGSSDAFALAGVPQRGTTVPPGGSATVKVAYRPREPGEHTGAVLVELVGAAPRLVPLRGTTAEGRLQRDEYLQIGRPKLDVLVVIDNGSTMAAEATRLVPELGELPAWLGAQRIDYQLAVTTTGLAAGGPGCPGGVNGGEDGRFFPVDGSRPRLLDENTPDLQAAWEANLAVGTCQTVPPQTLEAAYRALNRPLITAEDDLRHPEPADGNAGFLRDPDHLWVVAISDRVDVSPQTDEFYRNAFYALKPWRTGGTPTFIAITGARGSGCSAADGRAAAAGDRLIDLADRTTYGDFASICGADWRSVLPIASLAPRSCFFLGNQPPDLDGDGTITDVAGELRVLVDGVEVPSSRDGEAVWAYSRDQIAVCFTPGHLPEPEALVGLEYVVLACAE